MVSLSSQPKEGDRAPDFYSVDQDGKPINLSGYRGKKVVLYFYPKDDTPGCIKEACGFRDSLAEIGRMGVDVLGVSVDGIESHKRFAEKYSLPFRLVADDKKEITASYGVLKPTGSSAKRVTFLIDSQGYIRKIFPEVDPSGHAQEVIGFLKALS